MTSAVRKAFEEIFTLLCLVGYAVMMVALFHVVQHGSKAPQIDIILGIGSTLAGLVAGQFAMTFGQKPPPAPLAKVHNSFVRRAADRFSLAGSVDHAAILAIAYIVVYVAIGIWALVVVLTTPDPKPATDAYKAMQFVKTATYGFVGIIVGTATSFLRPA